MFERLTCFVFVLALGFSALGQDKFGFAHSNYSPSTTVFHNPANVVDNQVWLDFHQIGLGAFAYNNFVYATGSIFKPASYQPHQYNLSDRNKDAFVNLDVQLLSAAFQYKEHGFAITTRMRNIIDVRKIPADFAKILVTDIDRAPLVSNEYKITNLFVNQMSFAEFGFTYANAIYHFDKDLIVIGGTFNYDIGVVGGGLQIDELNYRMNSEDLALFLKFDAEYGYAAGWKAGTGFGLNVGVTYKRMLDNVTFYNPFSRQKACDHYLYKYKIGASLIDFGYVNFKKNATYQRFVLNVETEVEDFEGQDIMPENIGNFANDAFGSGLQITNDTKFKMWLPLALNLQFDYNFENNLYAAAQYTQAWPKRLWLGPERPTVLTIMPRWETKYLEGSIPLSVYNWEEFRVGAMVRFWGFAIGTDKLGSMLGLSGKSYGGDFYFHLKYMFFKKPGCERKSKKKKFNFSDCVKFK